MLMAFAPLAAFCFVAPASALTMKQCSEKYKSVNESGATGGMNWNEFRKAECGPDATMAQKTKAPSTAETGPSMQECSARYKAAKKEGTLGGMSWNEFRSAGCIAKVAAAPAAPAPTQAKAKTEPTEKIKVSEQQCSSRYQAAKTAGTLGGMTWNEFRSAGCPATMAKRSGSMTPTAGTIFPGGVDRKYASDSAGRARLMTCRDQYRANKAAGITQPRWTEQGGGYYSECNKRLSQ
jgi:hypothetical protein